MFVRFFTILIILTSFTVNSQDDLLEDLESNLSMEAPYTDSVFKGLKIINIESTKLAEKGALYFIVAHRFGSIENGFEDFFGLDIAVTKLQLVYGVNEWMNVGLARSSYQRTYGLHTKMRFLRQQQEGIPFTLGFYGITTVNTLLDKAFLPNLEFNQRLTHTAQLMISRKWNEKLSLQLSPTYMHENLTTINTQDNGQFILAMGGRYKLSNRVSFNLDYGLHTNRSDEATYRNTFSVGVEMETGGHVFQFQLTNSMGLNEAQFISNTTNQWNNAGIRLGFNLSRVFTIVKPKEL